MMLSAPDIRRAQPMIKTDTGETKFWIKRMD
jgi:hypothetical protein